MKIWLRPFVVLVLILAACSPAGTEATTTTAPSSSATSEGVGDATTTTSQPATTTTTTAAGTTTTEAPDVDADAIVMKKTAAVEAAMPDDWSVMTGPATTDEQADASFYEACLLADDLDIDNLDEISDAALLSEFEGPAANAPFPGQRGGIEARVFESEDAAIEAFSVFERVFGTEEGLECMTDAVQSLAGDDIPAEELIFSFEEVLVEGSQAGARFEMSFGVSGFVGSIFVEFQGARSGACTVIASFVTFGEPFDRDIADSLFAAAVNA